MTSVDNQEISLELGAIIKIIASNNPILDNKYFLIEYLDNDLIEIVGRDKIVKRLNIIDGELADKSITQIIIVDRPKEVALTLFALVD